MTPIRQRWTSDGPQGHRGTYHPAIMGRANSAGICDSCSGKFGFYLVHSGFSDCAYAYCRECGSTTTLDAYAAPAGVDVPIGKPLPPSSERSLKPCVCGGRFSGSASPRCPHCRKVLSAEKAASWIEESAEGTKQGWRWERSWQGLYCIVIDDQALSNNWDQP